MTDKGVMEKERQRDGRVIMEVRFGCTDIKYEVRGTDIYIYFSFFLSLLCISVQGIHS